MKAFFRTFLPKLGDGCGSKSGDGAGSKTGDGAGSGKIAGFTLLEILVVISIIGILIALGASAYSVAQKKGRDARRQGDLKQIQNAFEQYYSANSSTYAACATMDNVFPSTTMPTDPKGSAPYTYTCTVNAGNSSYCVCALLESGTGNATSAGASGACAYGSGNYFCVSNLQ